MKRLLMAVLIAMSVLFCGFGVYADDESALQDQIIDEELKDESSIENVAEEITDTSTIKIVQGLMNILGYDCGKADGIIGENTKNAIKDYQKSVGLKDDGVVSTGFVAYLYLDVRDRISKIKINPDDVLSTWESNNNSCDSAYQQASNGAYRIFELLTNIAMKYDKGSYSNEISDIRVEQLLQDLSASTALQQEANGLYRSVEMACVLAKELDKSGIYTSYIDGILDTLSKNNDSCSSAPQQIVNGEYRLVEILQVVGYLTDSKGTYRSFMDQVIDDLSANNANCSSAPQQSANGAYRVYDMCTCIYYSLDTKQKLASYASSIDDTKTSNNANCSSALQQEVNGLYRSFEMLYLITNLM